MFPNHSTTPKEVVRVKVNARKILQEPRSTSWRLWEQFRLLRLKDVFFSVELTSLWRRHLIWSHREPHQTKELLDIVTGRFASTQIFLSLLFAAEVGTYYSPSRLVTDVRNSLRTGPYEAPLEYATGIMLIVSIILTGAAVLANYTAFGVFRCVGHENVALILRCDVGLYAATLPSRLTFASIVTFFIWNVLFWWINVQDEASTGAICLTVLTILCVGHVISTFSALARMIMFTSAMGNTPILPRDDEESMLPHQLTNVLLQETYMARKLGIQVNQQYRHNNPNPNPNDTQQQKQQEQPNDAEEETPLTYEMSLRRRYPDVQVVDDIV